ncbi:MAG: hypothetical protein WKF84_03745 [Pyrinomonadaceae bacterium]
MRLAQAQHQLRIDEITLYDIDAARVELIAELCREVVRQQNVELVITTSTDLEGAVIGARYVLSSIPRWRHCSSRQR